MDVRRALAYRNAHHGRNGGRVPRVPDARQPMGAVILIVTRGARALGYRRELHVAKTAVGPSAAPD